MLSPGNTEWRRCRLDEIARLSVGGTPRRDNPAYWGGSIPWIGTSAVNFGWIRQAEEFLTPEGVAHSSAKVLPAGTILMAMFGQGATRGRVARLGVPAAFNQACLAIEALEGVDSDFLFHVLQHRYAEIRNLANGGAQANLNASLIGGIALLVPLPAVQSAIARLAGALATERALIGRLADSSRLLKRGLMQRVFSHDDRAASRVDGSCRTLPLASALEESRELASTGERARKLTIKLYGKGVVAKRDTRAGSAQTQYYRRSSGQFIYSKLDFLNGAFGLIPPELNGYESTLDLPAFEVSEDVNPRWLLQMFSWPGFYMRHLALANGGRKARRVNPAQLLRLNIAFPPREEQDRVASLLDALDQEIVLLENLASALDRQKRALLDKLLSGESRFSLP